MVAIDFGYFTYRGRDSQAGDYRLVNGYVEPVKGGKTDKIVVARPAIRRWDGASYAGVNRGMVPVRNSGLYAVLGNELVRFIDGSSSASLGAIGGASSVGLAGGLGLVTMAVNMRSNREIGVVTEDGFYYHYDTGSGTVTAYAGGNLPGVRSIDFLDRYFIFALEDGRIAHTDLDDAGDVNALAFAYAESRPDGLRRVMAHRGAAIAMGEASMEVWENAGTSPFAFAPIRSDIEIGLIGTFAAANVQDSLIWVDHHGQVQRMDGLEPQRISDHSLEQRIGELTPAQRAALRLIYGHWQGHHCAFLTSARWTYVYNKTTGLWSEANSRGREALLLQNSAEFNGEQIFGSDVDGKLYTLDPAGTSDDGELFVLECYSAPVANFPRGGVIDKVYLDMARGVGDLGGPDDAETPKVQLDWSVDGGKTYKGGRIGEIGEVGQYGRRIRWRKLGRFGENGVIFRLRISSSVRRIVMGAEADIRPLNK